mmetsp:Transcript_8209/g.20333  ORF Transcript_8209/g.20333 Transcript_8209/m.20333 type:complete len:201 (-) Transcript_8209:1581-2183(-)
MRPVLTLMIAISRLISVQSFDSSRSLSSNNDENDFSRTKCSIHPRFNIISIVFRRGRTTLPSCWCFSKISRTTFPSLRSLISSAFLVHCINTCEEFSVIAFVNPPVLITKPEMTYSKYSSISAAFITIEYVIEASAQSIDSYTRLPLKRGGVRASSSISLFATNGSTVGFLTRSATRHFAASDRTKLSFSENCLSSNPMI